MQYVRQVLMWIHRNLCCHLVKPVWTGVFRDVSRNFDWFFKSQQLLTIRINITNPVHFFSRCWRTHYGYQGIFELITCMSDWERPNSWFCCWHSSSCFCNWEMSFSLTWNSSLAASNSAATTVLAVISFSNSSWHFYIRSNILLVFLKQLD